MNKSVNRELKFLNARYEGNHPLVDTVWWQKDGVVNTNSMISISTNTAVNN